MKLSWRRWVDVYDVLESYGGVGRTGGYGRRFKSDDHALLGLEHSAAMRHLFCGRRDPFVRGEGGAGRARSEGQRRRLVMSITIPR